MHRKKAGGGNIAVHLKNRKDFICRFLAPACLLLVMFIGAVLVPFTMVWGQDVQMLVLLLWHGADRPIAAQFPAEFLCLYFYRP